MKDDEEKRNEKSKALMVLMSKVVMYAMYVHGGVVTMLDITRGGNSVLKSFKHSRRKKGMAWNL